MMHVKFQKKFDNVSMENKKCKLNCLFDFLLYVQQLRSFVFVLIVV